MLSHILSGPRGKLIVVAAALIVIAALFLVYVGLQDRDADLQENAAVRAAEDVAKAENPFETQNPLSNVEADPLGKAKEVLNPFE